MCVPVQPLRRRHPAADMGGTVSLAFASLVMLADSVLYIGLGMAMLSPRAHGVCVAELPEALFKRFSPMQCKRHGSVVEDCDEAGSGDACDDEAVAEMMIEGPISTVTLGRGLDMRLMAYILLVLGLCRLTTAFYWGCGYVALGLGSCLAEICMLCHELLRHESVCTQRAVGMVLLNSAVSLLYIGLALPHCR